MPIDKKVLDRLDEIEERLETLFQAFANVIAIIDEKRWKNAVEKIMKEKELNNADKRR